MESKNYVVENPIAFLSLVQAAGVIDRAQGAEVAHEMFTQFTEIMAQYCEAKEENGISFADFIEGVINARAELMETI